MSSESKTNLPAIDRAPSGKVAERQVNFYLVFVAIFGDLYHSSLICILIHSIQKVISPDLATWPADTGVHLPRCHSLKVRTSYIQLPLCTPNP